MHRPLFFFCGLVYLVGGMDAYRTSEAIFDWGIWIHGRAHRSERPIRFWMATLFNSALGARVMWLAIYFDP